MVYLDQDLVAGFASYMSLSGLFRNGRTWEMMRQENSSVFIKSPQATDLELVKGKVDIFNASWMNTYPPTFARE